MIILSIYLFVCLFQNAHFVLFISLFNFQNNNFLFIYLFVGWFQNDNCLFIYLFIDLLIDL